AKRSVAFGKKTGSSPDRRLAGSGPLQFIPSLRPANSMALNRKPILTMSWRRSSVVGPLLAGTNSCRGTGHRKSPLHKPHNRRPTDHAYGKSGPRNQEKRPPIGGL